MKHLEVKTAGYYPQWREYILKSNDELFTQVYLKLDKLLWDKFSYYIPGSLHREMLNTIQVILQRSCRRRINIGLAIDKCILLSLKATCGEFTITPKYLSANLEISNAINGLRVVMKDTAFMVQVQDSFDELKKLPINNN